MGRAWSCTGWDEGLEGGWWLDGWRWNVSKNQKKEKEKEIVEFSTMLQSDYSEKERSFPPSYPSPFFFLPQQTKKHLSTYIRKKKRTHRIQTPPRQNPLRRSSNTTPIPLQIPHDIPPTDLREHGSDLFDMGGIDDGAGVRPGRRGVGGGGGRGRGGFGEEEVADCDGCEGGEEEEGGDGEGLLLIGHCGATKEK